MTALVGLLLLTVVPIVAYTHHRNEKALLNLSEQLMRRLSEVVIQETERYLMPAAVMAELSTRVAAQPLKLIDNPAIEKHAIAVLEAYPQLTMFNMADDRGNFLMPKKMPDGTIAVKVIDRDAIPPTVTWKYRDAEGRVSRAETSHDVAYDPRVRPWYQGAEKAGGSYWTDLYILFTDQTPGITTAYPVHGADGRTQGVFGLDIELGVMSAFLRTLKVGKSGIVFIFNERYEAVAYHDVARIATTDADGKLRPAHLSELGDARIARFSEHYRKSGDHRFSFREDGVDYIASVADFPASFREGWRIGMVVPEDDFIGGLRQTARYTALISLAFLLLAVLLARILARSISNPIAALADEAGRIRDFQLEDSPRLDSSIKEIQHLDNALASMKVGLSAFRKYVPAALVQQLISAGEAARLGGHEAELTIFFSDIAGFTTISEGMEPQALMLHLSEYLDELTRIISAHQGTVDKYIGDSIMAFWGAPVRQDDHACRACHAALECQRRIQELNQRWEREGKVPFVTRIGVHTGKIVVGNVGSEERMNYSVVGDAANLASRLEGANKFYGTPNIVSHATYEQASDRFVFRPLDLVAVKGKTQGIMIYELMGEKGGEMPCGTEETAEAYAEGFRAYLDRDWDTAVGIFGRLGNSLPHDQPTVMLLNRCRALLDDPPDADWNGLTYLESK